MKTKNDMISVVAEAGSIGKKAATDIVHSLLDSMAASLRNGDDVLLSGIGRISTKQRAARTGRNPQTGKEIKIPAKVAVAFKASKTFTDSLNG